LARGTPNSNPRRESDTQLEQAKILRVFQLLDLLLQPWGQSVKDLTEALGSNARTVYRYLRLVGEEGLGYRVVRQKGSYRIPDTGRLTTHQLFSAEEKELLLQRLAEVGAPNPVLESIRRKVQLSAGLLPRPEELPALQRLIWAEQLREAIRKGCRVRLLGYRSTSTPEVRDRIVEPLYLSPELQLRAWEVAASLEKSFLLDRMQGVEMLQEAVTPRTVDRLPDFFGLADNDWLPVELLLTNRAHGVLIREYPAAARCCTAGTDPSWPHFFRGKVRGYEGIGRFVMGLPTEVRVVAPDAFRQFVREKSARALW
jgi:predicted DNA-binding transcriptional regulator YafY